MYSNEKQRAYLHIAIDDYQLMIGTITLPFSLLRLLPVFVFAFRFLRHYRRNFKKIIDVKYTKNWEAWWLVGGVVAQW
jgi:hypothetical protein